MDYNRLASKIANLLSPSGLGMSTSLYQTAKTRAATGGAITNVVTELSVNVVVTNDQTVFADGRSVRTIEAMLSGASPSVGDQLALPDGKHRIEKVSAIQPADVLIAYEVTLS